MKPSEILRKAADLIEPEGAWTQGEYGRLTNAWRAVTADELRSAICFCAIGAVTTAGRYSRVRDAEDGVAAEYLAREIGRQDVHRWNDAPGRTQAEVVKALRDAASLAEAEGR